jgi:hypothetical protein
MVTEESVASLFCSADLRGKVEQKIANVYVSQSGTLKVENFTFLIVQ